LARSSRDALVPKEEHERQAGGGRASQKASGLTDFVASDRDRKPEEQAIESDRCNRQEY
jgi:hypothetical protein